MENEHERAVAFSEVPGDCRHLGHNPSLAPNELIRLRFGLLDLWGNFGLELYSRIDVPGLCLQLRAIESRVTNSERAGRGTRLAPPIAISTRLKAEPGSSKIMKSAKEESLGVALEDQLQGKKSASHPYNVLFVCSDNVACSIIAEALLKRWDGDGFRAFSAGSRPGLEVNPQAIDLLKARRLWSQDLQPKGYDEFLRQDGPSMDFIISIGDRAPEGLPVRWPGTPRVIHWRISEPMVKGKPAEKSHALLRTLAELETRIKLFILVHERGATKRSAA